MFEKKILVKVAHSVVQQCAVSVQRTKENAELCCVQSLFSCFKFIGSMEFFHETKKTTEQIHNF